MKERVWAQLWLNKKEESMETMTVRNTAMTTAVDKKEQELTDMKLAQDIAAATF